VLDVDGNGVVNFAGDSIMIARASVLGINKSNNLDIDKNGLVNFAGDAIAHARRAVGVVACL